MRLQTFVEDTFEFRVLVDPVATFNFQPLPEQPRIAIVPGAPVRYVAALPTRPRPGERFALKVKGEDLWGNPTDACDVDLALTASGPLRGLPGTARLEPGAFSLVIADLVADEAGTIRVALHTPAGDHLADTNPLVIEDTELVHFWADLHGQSEETIGTGSAERYFAFARDPGFVDACGHQGNDFQITDAF